MGKQERVIPTPPSCFPIISISYIFHFPFFQFSYPFIFCSIKNSCFPIISISYIFHFPFFQFSYAFIFCSIKNFLKFKRRMLLHYHFFIRPNKAKTLPNRFKLGSNWEPPNYKQKSLHTYFEGVSKDLEKLYDQPKHNNTNLSLAEVSALENLEMRKEMIIKPADKGGKIVLWPTQLYIEEACRQLGDKSYYQEQTEDRTAALSGNTEKQLN